MENNQQSYINRNSAFREAYNEEIQKIENRYETIKEDIRRIGTEAMKRKWQNTRKHWYYLYQINHHEEFHALCAEIGEKEFYCRKCDAKRLYEKK